MRHLLALFGEAAKGDFRAPYFCQTPAELSEYLGEPPSKDSLGIPFALQALLFNRGVIYFRVHEEGFSIQDYLRGLSVLEKKDEISQISAICLPGVGNSEIIGATLPVCEAHKSFLIVTDKDFYDFLTYRDLSAFFQLAGQTSPCFS